MNNNSFNFDEANLSDLLSCAGECEHLYMHACKSASASEKEEAIYYQTISEMVKDFRRTFMREHFPNVTEKDWCMIKSAEALRQRVYESANTSYENLKRVNELWATIMEHIFNIDLSGCVACKTDKESAEERGEQKSQEK